MFLRTTSLGTSGLEGSYTFEYKSKTFQFMSTFTGIGKSSRLGNDQHREQRPQSRGDTCGVLQ